MKKFLFKWKIVFALIMFMFYAVNTSFSQVPVSLEKEYLEFNSAIYDALNIINTQNESIAIERLSKIKGQLKDKATSLSDNIEKIADLSISEENAFMDKMINKQILKDMIALMSNQAFIKKVENSQLLKNEYEEIMVIMDQGMGSKTEETEISESEVFVFSVGPGSQLSGSYKITADENNAFAYDDAENDQFVIEVHGDNYIDIMIIVENPTIGKHSFTMEMQVTIDISTNEGEDYFTFDNYQEVGGGYIQIDRIDEVGGKVVGSFSGIFNDGSTDEESPVKVEGRFSVLRM